MSAANIAALAAYLLLRERNPNTDDCVDLDLDLSINGWVEWAVALIFSVLNGFSVWLITTIFMWYVR